MLLTRAGQSYTNDAAGNTLTDAVSGRSMTWDAQNRMTSCTKNQQTTTFTYGADGLRRSMTANNVTTHYVLNGQSVVREGRFDNQQWVTTATYLHGPRGPEYKRTANGIEWYVMDGLGSVVATVDANGTVSSSRKYDVYGVERGTPAGGTSHKFVGGLGHTQDDTGLVYMRARYMDPATGRFVSEDPAGNGENWFAYAGADPVNVVDPDGERSLLQWIRELLAGAMLGRDWKRRKGPVLPDKRPPGIVEPGDLPEPPFEEGRGGRGGGSMGYTSLEAYAEQAPGDFMDLITELGGAWW